MTALSENFKRWSTRFNGRSAHDLRPWIDEAWATLSLGGPIILTQLAQMAIFTTDVVMLGWVGSDALAAGALGANLYFLLWIVLSGPTFAVSPVIAQAKGADPTDTTTPQHAVRMGLWTAVIVGPIGILLLSLSEPVFLALGQTQSLATDASRYLMVLSPGLAFAIGFMVLRNFTTALDRPRPSLYVLIATIAVNGVLAATFIFGLFGFPKMGVVGAGLAATLANLFSFSAMSVVVLRNREFRRFRVFEDLLVFDKPMFKELVRVGVPIGLTMLAEGSFFGAGAFVMGSFGIDELAAHQVAINICSITFMVPLGIAMAGVVRVGHAAGAGDMEAARRAGYTVILIGGAFMTLCGVIMWTIPETLIGLYLGDGGARVTQLAISYLVIAAFFQLFDALQVAAAFALRGLKDTKVPMYLAAGSYWLIGFTSAIGLAFGLGWEGSGVWTGFVIGLIAAAVAMVVRFAWMSHTSRPSPDVESTELEEGDLTAPLARAAA